VHDHASVGWTAIRYLRHLVARSERYVQDTSFSSFEISQVIVHEGDEPLRSPTCVTPTFCRAKTCCPSRYAIAFVRHEWPLWENDR